MNLIEYLNGQKEEGSVNIDILKQVNADQNKKRTHFKIKAIDANFSKLWDTICIGNWKVQQQKFNAMILNPVGIKFSSECRVLNENNEIVSYGTSEEYWRLFENAIRNDRAKWWADKTGYGLVLEGGGGKGAFEIGVWKYLREIGIDKEITGISGASVGALNSLLFVGGGYDIAEELWQNIEQKDMTPVNTNNIILILLQLLAGYIPETIVKALLERKLSNSSGICSQSRLEGIMEEKIDWNRVKYSSIVAYCSLSAVVNYSNQTLMAIGLDIGRKLLQFKSIPEYCCWSKLEKDKIKSLVLASAALPVVYGGKNISGQKYLDGGIHDNCPVKPLVEAGFRKIIVVHLHEPQSMSLDGEWEKSITGLDCRGIRFYHVYPHDEKYNNLKETMTVNPRVCKERIDDGYRAAKVQLSSVF